MTLWWCRKHDLRATGSHSVDGGHSTRIRNQNREHFAATGAALGCAASRKITPILWTASVLLPVATKGGGPAPLIKQLDCSGTGIRENTIHKRLPCIKTKSSHRYFPTTLYKPLVQVHNACVCPIARIRSATDRANQSSASSSAMVLNFASSRSNASTIAGSNFVPLRLKICALASSCVQARL
jgi:hypothetical protein